MPFYEEMQNVATDVLSEFSQGTCTLRRSVPGDPDPETPWIPGSPTVTDYALDATVKGVSQQYVDGTLILATDLEIVASTMGADEDGARVAIVPDFTTDTLLVDGKAVALIRDLSVPAAGAKVALRFVVRG